MKKLAAFAGIASLLAGLALVGPSTAAPAARKAETLKFTSVYKDNQFTTVDADQSGDDTAGDSFTGNFVLRHGGKTRGHLEFNCVLATVQPSRDLCTGVVHISGRGELSVTDVSPHDSDHSKAIVNGGSGSLGGAQGHMTLDFRRHRVTVTIVVR